jgi:hypothetical protein
MPPPRSRLRLIFDCENESDIGPARARMFSAVPKGEER